METKTTFRSSLVGELRSLAKSVELDERFVQIDYVEDKKDVIGEFLDYYTTALLEYGAFEEQFTRLEIASLRKFLRTLEEAFRIPTRWEVVRKEASNLLTQLTP